MSPNEFVTAVLQGGIGPEKDRRPAPPDLDPGAAIPPFSEPGSPAAHPVAGDNRSAWADDLPALARVHLPGHARRRGHGKRLVVPAGAGTTTQAAEALGVALGRYYLQGVAAEETGPPTKVKHPIDGVYPYGLAVRDLEAASAQAELALLFTVHAASLVLKSDNHSALLAARTKSLLFHWQVRPALFTAGGPWVQCRRR